MTDAIVNTEFRVSLTPQAITEVQKMHSAVKQIRALYGETHPVTVEALSSFTNSLVTMLNLGGTIFADSSMALIGTNSFGFTFGMVAHKRNVPDEYVKVYDAPIPLTFSVNS